MTITQYYFENKTGIFNSLTCYELSKNLTLPLQFLYWSPFGKLGKV
jgi:hypothetical protein